MLELVLKAFEASVKDTLITKTATKFRALLSAQEVLGAKVVLSEYREWTVG